MIMMINWDGCVTVWGNYGKDENNEQERNLGEDVEEVKIFLTD